MRIVDKVQFILGVFDIVVGVGMVIATICLHRYSKLAFAVFPVVIGISALCRSIETKKQRMEKENRIKEQARLLGIKVDD